MKQSTTVTKEFLRGFKKQDLVDVRIRYYNWSGPHKLVSYKIAASTNGAKPAAYIVVELDGKKLARWLVEGDRQVIRKHVSQNGKLRQPTQVQAGIETGLEPK